jgi:hypothetical protein
MYTLHHHPFFHKLRNLSDCILKRYHYEDRQLVPDTITAPQPLPHIPTGTRKILDDLHLPYYDPLLEPVDFALDTELSIP